MREHKSIIELIGDISNADIVLNTDVLYEIPFCDVVKKEVEKLKNAGRLFIPIYNKMGMKYWAGCQADDGYAFTRQELVDMLEELHISDYRFLYPYPDHIHPMAIYSDEYLPKKGELSIESYNFEKERLVLFHEGKAYDMILNEKLFPQFSNSFLLVIGAGKEEAKTIFTKFSYERAKEFAIKTDIIVKENGEKKVKKSAIYPESVAHMNHMYDCFKGLSKHLKEDAWAILPCEKEADAVVFPYINGETLANQLYSLVSRKDSEALIAALDAYISNIRVAFGTMKFEKTDAFRKVFGEVMLPEEHSYTTSDYNNIDLVLDNVLVDEEKNYFIDYEWTFDFPVPLEFTIYRILFYFILRSENKQWLEAQNLYRHFDISEKEIEVFEEMEENFQNYTEGGHIPIRDLYEMEGAGRLDIGAVVYAYKKQVLCNQGRIYFDYGQGFTEQAVQEYKAVLEDGVCKIELDIPEGIKAFRIDPEEDYGCLIQLYKFEDENGNSLCSHMSTNGKKGGDDVYLFATKDPWFKCKDAVKKVYLEYRISVCDDELLKRYDKTADIRKVVNKIFK